MSQQKQAKQQFQYQQWAQQQEWNRQDTQLRRMVKDAQAAGISPLAALGQGNYAQPTQSASGQAVDPFSAAAQSLGRGISSIQTKQQVENNALQNDLLRAQIEQAKAATRSDTLSQMESVARSHTVANAANHQRQGATRSKQEVVNLTPPGTFFGDEIITITDQTPDLLQLPVPGLMWGANKATDIAMKGYNQYVDRVARPLDSFLKEQSTRLAPRIRKKGQKTKGRRQRKRESMRN